MELATIRDNQLRQALELLISASTIDLHIEYDGGDSLYFKYADQLRCAIANLEDLVKDD